MVLSSDPKYGIPINFGLAPLPDDDCGGLTQAAQKQHREGAGSGPTIFPPPHASLIAAAILCGDFSVDFQTLKNRKLYLEIDETSAPQPAR